jgi:hypothetical protein
LFGFLLQKNGFTAYMVTLAVYYLVWKWALSLSLSLSFLLGMYVLRPCIKQKTRYTQGDHLVCPFMHCICVIGFFAAKET